MKHKLISKILCAVLVATAAIGGFYGASRSWDGTVIVHAMSFEDRRSPAAIQRVFDFSHLDGDKLRLASQKRLVTDARTILGQDEVGIELGHFVTKGDNGARLFACEYFDRLTLSFEAEGLASNGDKATMKIDAPCRMGPDLNRIAAIWVPTRRIVEEKPVDMDLAYKENDSVRFRFDNMPSQWPRSWIMTSIRIYNDAETGRELSISHPEMREIAERPIRVAF